MKKNIGAQLALYPMPIAVIGAMNVDKPTWTLVAHMGIIGHDRVLVSLASAHFINSAIKKTGKLSINLVDREILPQADDAGAISGAKQDKSDLFAYELGEAKTPMIVKAPLTMECSVVDVYLTPHFESFICTIDCTYVEEKHLEESGKINYRTLQPVLFEFPTYQYLQTGDIIGKCLSFHKNEGESPCQKDRKR